MILPLDREDFCFDKATGIRLNTNMIDDKKPMILDRDPVTSIAGETRSGNAAYGASRILYTPATPEKVLQALGKDRRRGIRCKKSLMLHVKR